MRAMGGLDTTMGGALSRFPSTSMSMVARSAEGARRDHFERLASAYWKPIYYFVRRSWSKSDADAKDLTQSFLIHVLENDVIGKFDPARGNFRGYLKQCLRHFMTVDARNAAAQKRGGGRTIVAIDCIDPGQVPASQGSADDDFDRDWSQAVLDRALRETESRLREAGKRENFEILRAYAYGPEGAEPPSYADVGKSFGLSATDVANRLRMVRQELRERVLAIISEYVSSDDDIVAEASRIIGEP